jgi:hypothetical protein
VAIGRYITEDVSWHQSREFFNIHSQVNHRISVPSIFLYRDYMLVHMRGLPVRHCCVRAIPDTNVQKIAVKTQDPVPWASLQGALSVASCPFRAAFATFGRRDSLEPLPTSLGWMAATLLALRPQGSLLEIPAAAWFSTIAISPRGMRPPRFRGIGASPRNP